MIVAAALVAAGLSAQAQARTAGAADAASCPLPIHTYEDRQYVVRTIRIEAVVDVFGVVKTLLDAELVAAQAKLDAQGRGLHAGAPFTNVDGYFALQTALADRLQDQSLGERFAFASIAPSLEGCDDAATPPALDVVYRVFTTQPISYATTIFEKKFERPDRSAVPTMLASGIKENLPLPTVGYNASRGLFAGARVRRQLPIPGFNQLDAAFTGSTTSATVDATLVGARDFDAVLGHVDWRFGGFYSNLPSGALQLKKLSWVAQGAAATRQLGGGIVLRFGGALESGGGESTLSEIRVPLGDVNDDRHAGKIYGGATINRGRQSWSASYGVQLGTDAPAWRIDYGKQVVDGVYTARFLPREHLPLSLDARITGGWILADDSAAIPIVERYFGGNAIEDFIRGDTWRINAAPVIRSFPQNAFVPGPATPGGEHFVSANVTVGQTIWNRSAIPAEVRHDADLNVQLESAILVMRNSTISTDTEDSAAMKAAKALLGTQFAPLFTGLTAALDRIPSAGLPAAAADALGGAHDDVDSALEAAKAGRIIELLIGFGGADPLLQTIREDIADLRRQLPAHDAELGAIVTRFDPAQQQVLRAFESAQSLGYVPADAFRPALTKLSNVETLLTRVRDRAKMLAAVPVTPSPECAGWPNAVTAVVTYAEAGLGEVMTARDDADKVEGFTKVSLKKLSQGAGPMFPPRLTSVVSGVRELKRLSACVTTDLAPLDADAGEAARLQRELEGDYNRLNTPPIERKADRDLSHALRVLDVIFREMNVAAVSPVVTFDVARIGPGGDGARYALGGGVKLTVVTLDVTAGYAVTIHRQPGEPRGAFLFALDVSDLFR